MKRIVVKLTGMPFDPAYEIDDDTIAISDPYEYPAAAQASQGRRDRTGHRREQLLHRTLQAHHQGHLRGSGRRRGPNASFPDRCRFRFFRIELC